MQQFLLQDFLNDPSCYEAQRVEFVRSSGVRAASETMREQWKRESMARKWRWGWSIRLTGMGLNGWLVVWSPFFIFPYIGNNHPNSLIFFRGVQTTNQNGFECFWWVFFSLISSSHLCGNSLHRETDSGEYDGWIQKLPHDYCRGNFLDSITTDYGGFLQ